MAQNPNTISAVSPRRTFGDRSKAWMEVAVTPDGQGAFLEVLCLGGDTTIGVRDVVDALEEVYSITAEIDTDKVGSVVEKAAAKPREVIRDRQLIARGIPPGAGVDGKIVLKFSDGLLDGASLPYDALKTALSQKAPEEVVQFDLLTRMVFPGEVLAVTLHPTEGRPGRDVFGQVRKEKQMGGEALLKAGDHVKFQDERYVSEIYGYVCLLKNEISVLSPVWMAPDYTSAHFIYFRQAGAQRLPEAQWLVNLLKSQGIKKGIDTAVLGRLWQDVVDRREPGFFTIAEGKDPVDGVNGRLALMYDPEKYAGEILEDGSIDLRERHSSVAVQERELLAELHPATAGETGYDLLGNETAPRPGSKKSLRVKEGVSVERRGDGSEAFYAKKVGQVWCSGDAIQVHEVLRIDGDLAYDMGNIEAGKDVLIMGSVQPGFKIRAHGNVEIRGVAESGSAISADGDVVVSGGIVGDTTKVVAMGTVMTKFIQNSTVMARGNIVVGSYVFNGKVRSGGSVVVHHRGRSRRAGSIVGGQVVATTEIVARLIGSSSSDRTFVGIESNVEIKMRLEKLKETIAFCDANIVRMFRALGLRDLDAENVRNLIKRTPANRRKQVAVLLRKMKELVIFKETSLSTQHHLEQEMVDTLAEAEIVVRGRMYSYTSVMFRTW
jgi:uncharacterized protein (DUF342 family)